MKRMTLFVMALVVVLGLAQCKKEQSITPDTQGVTITLNLDGNNNGATRMPTNKLPLKTATKSWWPAADNTSAH